MFAFFLFGWKLWKSKNKCVFMCIQRCSLKYRANINWKPSFLKLYKKWFSVNPSSWLCAVEMAFLRCVFAPNGKWCKCQLLFFRGWKWYISRLKVSSLLAALLWYLVFHHHVIIIIGILLPTDYMHENTHGFIVQTCELNISIAITLYTHLSKKSNLLHVAMWCLVSHVTP